MDNRTGSKKFRRYVALGDSISIDLYPSLDLGSRREMEPPEGVGAASLLCKNQDSLWPEFAGHDLSTRSPGIEFVDFTADGAMTFHVLDAQLPGLPRDHGAPTLVTLTVGGNDLLQLFAAEAPGSDQGLRVLLMNLREILRRLHWTPASAPERTSNYGVLPLTRACS